MGRKGTTVLNSRNTLHISLGNLFYPLSKLWSVTCCVVTSEVVRQRLSLESLTGSSRKQGKNEDPMQDGVLGWSHNFQDASAEQDATGANRAQAGRNSTALDSASCRFQIVVKPPISPR